MTRTLLVTNDFPPKPGGIQAYLHSLASRLPPAELVVYAPSGAEPPAALNGFDREQPFEVVRHPGSAMLPSPAVLRGVGELLASRGLETVWFGAAAPLALLSPALRRAGARRIVASTHGHEVGWSMAPGARQALRCIGESADVVTYVSRYTRRRFAAAFGPRCALEYLPPGVDAEGFRPDAGARKHTRRRLGLGGRPTIVCVSRLVARKGQDQLVRALPELRARVPGVALLLVGDGRDRARVTSLARRLGVAGDVVLTGSVPHPALPAYYAAGDVFAMPVRTRAGGLDVEGLGIVYLEAQAAGLPVVAGDSGGAPEAVCDGGSGHVIDGRDRRALTEALAGLLGDPTRAAAMGAAGRQWVSQRWGWDQRAERLAELLSGSR